MSLYAPFRHIAVIAPAGKPDRGQCENGFARLRETGHVVTVMPHVFSEYSGDYCAAEREDRAADLMAAWLAPETDLVLCARGGFGAAHILPLIDWERLKKSRPDMPLAGFSDITALHMAMLRLSVGTPVAAPMAGKLVEAEADPFTVEHEKKLWSGLPYRVEHPCRVLQGGSAEGTAVYANLSVLVTLAGTPFMPDFTGRVLFLEDLNEPIYKIDRYLTQLEQCGVLDQVAAVAFGGFLDCGQAGQCDRLLEDFANRHRFPVLAGYPFSHALPFAPMSLRRRVMLENSFITVI
ncbi:MAG: LD-carboxypeptidase [Victivallaceae bacterium]|nr:LD-carboxypeptidase [Victivallaceae bacterium]